jgi:hypothetical protein
LRQFASGSFIVGLLRPDPTYHLLVLAAFVAVFALIPLSLYMHSGEDWGFSPRLLLRIAALGLVLWALAALAISLLAVVHRRAAASVAAAIFCTGTFLLLSHVYAPVPIGPLDGSALISPEPLVNTVIEGGLLLVLLFVLIFLARGLGVAAASLFALLLLVVTAGYAVTATLTRPAASDHLNPQALGTGGAKGNVYHFVLDALQTDTTLEVLRRRPDLAAAFQGFTLFASNVSNYLTTRKSSASYFTSTLYNGDDGFPRWQNSWRRQGLMPLLAQAGYTIWMYSPFPDWERNRFAYRFQYSVDIYERGLRLRGTDFSDFLHIWLIGLAPNPLTNEAVGPAGELRDRLYRLLVGDVRPLTVPEGVHPYAGVLMMRQLQIDEVERPPDSQYVYVHPALPHPPTVMDRECTYVGRRPGRDDTPAHLDPFLDQSECALALTVAFLRHLQELGRYDPATIVVHSDHGLGHGFLSQPPAPVRGDLLGLSRDRVLSRVSTPLMVKPAGARGELVMETMPTQLIDLLPTLVELLDLPPPGYPMRGTSLFALDPVQRRDTMIGLDPGNMHGPNVFELRIEDPEDLINSPLTVLGRAGSWGRVEGRGRGADGQER